MEHRSNSPYVKSLEERLLGLFTAACAPLSSDSLVNDVADLEPSDFTVPVAIDEVKFLKSLAEGGLSAIVDAFECIPPELLTEDESSLANKEPAVSVALLSTATFATRLAFVCTQVHTICMNAVDRLAPDPTALMKSLETRAKQGQRPSGATGELLRSCLDYTPNSRWAALELPLKNRVGFKETAAVIFENKVGEEALKEPGGGRRKQRNPTGFHKFNFKDLMLESSDTEGDRRSRSRSTDDGSTHGSFSISGTTAGGALTSRSASSGAEEEDDIDDMPEAYRITTRRNSSVVFNPCEKGREIIEDPSADPDWELQQRHQKRFSRIRNRVPTGHPSVMKCPGEELAGIVHEYERSLSSLHLDSATAENTQANKHTQVKEEDEEAAAAIRATASASAGRKCVTLSEDPQE